MGELVRRAISYLFIYCLILVPGVVNSEGEDIDSSMGSALAEPDTPTGYSFANEIGGEVISIEVGPNGTVYALTETGLLACIDPDGDIVWRRYYDEVDHVDHYVFPNGNLLVSSDKLEIFFPNGTSSVLFSHGYDYRGNIRTFGDKVVYWESNDKIHCIDQTGEVLWKYFLNYISMNGIGNASGDYKASSYEIRKDLQIHQDGSVSFILYDDYDSYSYYRTQPSIFINLDKNGRRTSWWQFEDIPWRNFEMLHDDSLIITEQDPETEEAFAVRINKEGNYLWKVPVDDYGSKIVIDTEDGRMVYYRLMADYDEENVLFLYDLEGNILKEREVLPRSVTDIRVMGDRILMTYAGNGTEGTIQCLDRDLEPLWTRPVKLGISSNVIPVDDQYFYILGSGTMLQKWSMEGEMIFESRIWTFDNIYMNSHMESLMDYEIGYVYMNGKLSEDDDGNVYLGLMRVYKLSSEGDVQWETILDGSIESSPIEGLEGDVIVGGKDGFLYSFDKEGNERWSVEIGSTINSRPLLHKDGEGYIVTGSMGWMRLVGSDGSFKWSYRLNGSVYSPPVMDASGNIYAVTWPGTVFSLHPNGTVNWTLVINRTVSNDLFLVGNHTLQFFAWGDLVQVDLINHTYRVKDYGSYNRFYSGPYPLGKGEMIGVNETVVWFDMDGNVLRISPANEYLYSSTIDVGPDGRIFIGEHNSGHLHCFLPNGSLDWSIDIGERNVRPKIFGNYTLLVACEGLSRIDPYTGDIIWNFKMDFRTHTQGYTESVPWVMEDGSILFCFDRIYRFTDTDTGGQFSELELDFKYSFHDVYWSYDVPVGGGFITGFRVFKNDTDGRIVEYKTTNFEETRINEWNENNGSLVYEYQIEWYDHLGNSGSTRIFNTTEDFDHYTDITPYDMRPRNFTADYKDGKVILTWDPPVDEYEKPVSSYVIYRYEDDQWVLVDEVGPTVHRYEDDNVSRDEGYWYYIEAWTSSGYSGVDENVYVYTSGPMTSDEIRNYVAIPVIFAMVIFLIGLLLIIFRKESPLIHNKDRDRKMEVNDGSM